MWITQTYLRFARDVEAKVYVYFLFEKYDNGQDEFSKRIEQSLHILGREARNRAHLFYPHFDDRDAIREELLNKARKPLISKVSKGLPGLLFCEEPLQSMDLENDRWVFLGLKRLRQRSQSTPDLIPAYFQALEHVILHSENILLDVQSIERKKFSEMIKIKLGLEWAGSGIQLGQFDEPFRVSNKL